MNFLAGFNSHYVVENSANSQNILRQLESKLNTNNILDIIIRKLSLSLFNLLSLFPFTIAWVQTFSISSLNPSRLNLVKAFVPISLSCSLQ